MDEKELTVEQHSDEEKFAVLNAKEQVQAVMRLAGFMYHAKQPIQAEVEIDGEEYIFEAQLLSAKKVALEEHMKQKIVSSNLILPKQYR